MPNGRRHVPEVEQLINASPIPMGPAVRAAFAKHNEYANRHVPSAADRFPIETVIFQNPKHID